MIRLTPILLAILVALVMYRFSTWRMGRILDARSTPLADPQIEALSQRMAQVLGLKNLKVHVFEIDPVNGLAAADGRIFITRGFLKKYAAGEVSAEELASVIAHELGHVALGHSKRRMIDFSGQNAIRTILTLVLARFIPFIGPWIATMLSNLLAARLSRQDEYEADAYAAALLTKSGIGTEPQKSLFRKLDRMTMALATPPAWLMTHPKAEARIAAIERLDEAWQD